MLNNLAVKEFLWVHGYCALPPSGASQSELNNIMSVLYSITSSSKSSSESTCDRNPPSLGTTKAFIWSNLAKEPHWIMVHRNFCETLMLTKLAEETLSKYSNHAQGSEFEKNYEASFVKMEKFCTEFRLAKMFSFERNSREYWCWAGSGFCCRIPDYPAALARYAG